MNELIGLLAIQRNISPAGLQQLQLLDWSISEPLDDSILQELFAKCHSLTTLGIVSMHKMPGATRLALA